MKITEREVRGKTGRAEECEDAIVACDAYAAVIDGATDITGTRFDGVSGGRFLAAALTELIPDLPPGLPAVAAVELLTREIAARLPEPVDPTTRPAASAVIYSAERREIWSIGDCRYWHAGLPAATPGKRVDEVASAMRAAVLTAHLAQGIDPEVLRSEDRGRAAIRELLLVQRTLANNPDPQLREFAFPVLNGLPVPEHLIDIHPVPDDVHEIVLTSDGFPEAHPTLAATRARLAALLAQDPLCINELRTTKAPKPGASQYDDTAYLRIAL